MCKYVYLLLMLVMIMACAEVVLLCMVMHRKFVAVVFMRRYYCHRRLCVAFFTYCALPPDFVLGNTHTVSSASVLLFTCFCSN